MRICLLSDKYPPDLGGLAVSVQRLADGLQQAGHAVCVIAPDVTLPPGQLRHIVAENLTIDRFGAARREDDTRVDWFERVARRHSEAPFDVVVGYYLVGAGFVATYVGRYLGVPVVVSARGNDLERAVFAPARGGGVLWALQQADAVTAVSLYLRFAFVTLGREEHIFPAFILDDWGKEQRGLRLYQWVAEFGEQFPRGEIFGFEQDGAETQCFLRALELYAKYPLYVYTDRKQPVAAGTLVEAILLPDATVRESVRGRRPLAQRPLSHARVSWWRVPPSLILFDVTLSSVIGTQ